VLADGVGEIDDTSLHIWFESIVPVSLEKEILTISVPNSFAKQYIETRFGDLIRQGLRELQGEGARLEVEVLEVRAR
jgi:chromosomal replication initiator protein